MSLHVNHPGVALRTGRDQREFVLRLVRWIAETHPDSVPINKVQAAAGPCIEDFDKVSPIDCRVYNNPWFTCVARQRAGRSTRGSYSLPLIPRQFGLFSLRHLCAFVSTSMESQLT